MTPVYRRLPLALLQLTHSRVRLGIAILGVGFAALLVLLQLGLQASLEENATLVEDRLDGDLFVVSKYSRSLQMSQPFSRRLLIRARDFDVVQSVGTLDVGMANWRNPWTGVKRAILVLGLSPDLPVLDIPEVHEQLGQLRSEQQILFDRSSRKEFGPVSEALASGSKVRADLDGRKADVTGLFSMGASFAADGTVIAGESAFRRLVTGRAPGATDVGVIKLRAGVSHSEFQRQMKEYLSPNLQVFTREELTDWERTYWESGSVGFIFQQGVIIGFIIGVAIVYQILYTDIANHLPEYATLKAIGYSDRYLLGVVFQEAFLLSVLGYIPGLLASALLYFVTEKVTAMSLQMTSERALGVFALTLVMCFVSGGLAVRKLRSADPAEVF
jgi:putative ABC transport system permease protein